MMSLSASEFCSFYAISQGQLKSESEVVYGTGRLQGQILEASGARSFGQSKLLHAPAANSNLIS